MTYKWGRSHVMKDNKIDKTIWMCWFQGEDHKSLTQLNRLCINRWRELNPDWDVKVLTNETIGEYVPEYFDIIGNNHVINATRSEVVRILLLKKYGGIWADASLYPVEPLSDFIDIILNDVGFFTYRFIPRSIGPEMGNRETVSWFLAVNQPNHYLITKWSDKFTSRFMNWPSQPKYFQFHEDLASLYDSDEKIKYIIDNMVQIDREIPTSALEYYGGWDKRKPSYMYKRPKFT